MSGIQINQVNFNLEHLEIHSNNAYSENQGTLTFVDFVPSENKSYVKNLFSKQEKYNDLIHRINQWLLEHPKWKAKTIETIMFDPENSFGKDLLYVHNNEEQGKKFGIRLWISDRLNQQQPIQQIKVLNIIPKLKISGHPYERIFENQVDELSRTSAQVVSEFESIDEILINLNKFLLNNKYFGQMINIETVFMPVKSDKWTVDTEELDWPKENFKGVMQILKIHFNQRVVVHETVEIFDFAPKMEIWNAPLAVPNLESSTSLLKRASHELKKQLDPHRFLSCCTVCCPAMSSKSENFIETKKAYYTYKEWNCLQTFSAKFIRIAIAKPKSNIENFVPTVLNCKIFVPCKKDNRMNYQKADEVKNFIREWFTKTDVEILSVETETISSTTGLTSTATMIDTCLQMKKLPNDNLIAFKVYINGHYSEPLK